MILDIFAQNARSPEGKAQVELALLRYRLPRLRGRGQSLSQQAGGIGTRGPGETQLEVDRRRLVRRMHRLEDDLRDGDARPGRTQRAQRRPGPPAGGVARRLHQRGQVDPAQRADRRRRARRRTGSSRPSTPAPASSRCPVARRCCSPTRSGSSASCPHELVEAFRSTLDSVRLADLLVHVVDASAPDPEAQIDAVRTVLARDRRRRDPRAAGDQQGRPRPRRGRGALGRARRARSWSRPLTGEGIDELLRTLGDRLRATDRVVELRVPYDRGDVLAAAHREGEVVGRGDDEEATVRPRGARRGRPGSASRACVAGGPVSGARFAPPPYPYDRLAAARAPR